MGTPAGITALSNINRISRYSIIIIILFFCISLFFILFSRTVDDIRARENTYVRTGRVREVVGTVYYRNAYRRIRT